MAPITFNAAHQKEHIREQLETALAVLREMLDGFVSYRMRLVVSEAENVGPRQRPGASSPSVNAQ
jgi:hypothetical protein